MRFPRYEWRVWDNRIERNSWLRQHRRVQTGLSRIFLALFLVFFPKAAFGQVELWVSNPDNSALFQKQNAALTFTTGTYEHPTIAVDDTRTYQTIDGFGFTLTGGSAMHIVRMASAARAALLRELFATDGTNIGTSYLRLSIGASDLNERVFSYNDLPAGQIDVEMKKFDLGPDRADVIPVLKEILAINPAIKLMGSPWSAPTWMKTTNDTRGASLKPEFHDAYARYFVKYIQAMKAEGIRIDAITIQNEPLHPGNNPSMFMSAPQQATFIKRNLGPALAAAKLDTKIVLYDHNCDRPDYPISILNDPEAAKHVDGSAFHLYAGKIEALTKVNDAHPNKNIYFTEQWVGAPGNLHKDLTWHVRELIIGATRNWSRTVLEWNLASKCTLGTAHGPGRMQPVPRRRHHRRQQRHAQSGLLHHRARGQIRAARLGAYCVQHAAGAPQRRLQDTGRKARLDRAQQHSKAANLQHLVSGQARNVRAEWQCGGDLCLVATVEPAGGDLRSL